MYSILETNMSERMIGRVFGNLTVKSVSDTYTLFGGIHYSCVCKCGVEKVIALNDLISRNVKDCGCIVAAATILNSTYKKFATIEMKIWDSIVDKCYNSYNKEYHLYGGKGITVCDRWKDSFENFYEDMGPRANIKQTVALNRNSNVYGPGNCKWYNHASYITPGSDPGFYEYNGKKLTTTELSKLPEAIHNRLRVHHLRSRIVTLGWSVEKALSAPIKGRKRNSLTVYTYNGVTKTIVQWAEEYKINYHKLYNRIMRSSWDFNRAVTTP
jgi:hypothetical protein